LSLLFIALIVLSLSCKKKGCTPDYVTYLFEPNKEMRDTTVPYGTDSLHSFYIIPGNNILFKYTFGAGGCGFRTDSYAQYLNFQIDQSLAGFEYKDSSILTTKCYFSQSGEVSNDRPQKITQGIIKGSKHGATKWDITVNVQPSLGPPVSFTKTF